MQPVDAVVIYLQHRLACAGLHRLHGIGVLPTVEDHLLAELCTELQAAFPDATVAVASEGPETRCFDVVVAPFTRSLHRRFLRDKTPLVARSGRLHTRAFLFYDIAHRRTDVVLPGRLWAWYARRLAESWVILAGRRIGWRKS